MLRSRTLAFLLVSWLSCASPCLADHFIAIPSAGAGLPLGPTASLMLGISLDHDIIDSGSGAVLDGSIGIDSGAISVGYVAFSRVLPRITAVRTWEHPVADRPYETFVGPSFLLLWPGREKIELGLLYGTDGPKKGGRLMPYVSVGVIIWAFGF